ncbi:MAG: Flp family type IVb pilin [Hyphomicrobiales bacterium]|jgi:pilus assembly protein Flp/PilA
MFRHVKTFIADTSAATAIEYGLIVGLIFLAILTSFYTLQGNLENVYRTIGNAVGSAGN